MSPELNQELRRLNRDMNRVVGGGSLRTSIAAEAPLRIHSRDVDAGGAPEWHPAFERWIDAEWHEDPRPARFRESNHRMHPARMKRALRQLRRLDAKAHEAINLMAVHGYSWAAAREKMNEDNLRRGDPPYSEVDFLCLTISGTSLFLAGW